MKRSRFKVFYISGTPRSAKHRHSEREKFRNNIKEYGAKLYHPDDKILLDLEFYVPENSSWSVKESTGSPHKTIRYAGPDLDSLIYFVMNALEGVLIHNDNQVYEIRARKRVVKSNYLTIIKTQKII